MFGQMFGLFAKSQTGKQLVLAQLNARLQPMHRAEYFEEALDSTLQDLGLGEVSGGGSLLASSGEVTHCNIEILAPEISSELIQVVVETLEELGAPKGSLLMDASGKKVAFGTSEGLAVYLNGTDLPAATYAECDSNFVLDEFNRLLGTEGGVYSHWLGAKETAFYMYGRSFAQMKASLEGFLASYPLCRLCRIEQIA
jgi:hypothetical protein